MTYGECSFFTISLNEQYLTLVLRLSRFGQHSPCVRYSPAWVATVASLDCPKLQAQKATAEGAVRIERLELLGCWACACASNALAAMAPDSIARTSSAAACDHWAACLVACQHFGGGTQDQADGTPHFHAEGHIACDYQFPTLRETADRLKAGLLEVG